MGRIHSSWRRRAVTTVIAGASAIALAAPSVSAAPGAGPGRFDGQAQALALDLDLNLPGGLGSPAGKIEQLISQTLTQLNSEGKVAAKADLLSGLLEQPALEFKGNKKSDSTRLVSLPENPIVNVDAGELSYTADAAGRITNAASQLLDLRVGLADTPATRDAVNDALETLKKLIGQPKDAETETAEGTLNDILGTIEDLANTKLPETDQVDIPTVLPTQLPQIPELKDLTNLVSAEKLWSETSTLTESASNAIVSKSEAGVVNMNLLGGLVEVPDFVFSSLAKTTGQPGGASAEAVTGKLQLKIANSPVIGLSGDDLTFDGESLDLGGLGLDQQLEQVKKLLESILNAVGLDITQAKKTEQVAPDGSYALARTDALAISLSPLQALANQDPRGGLNVALSLLPTESEVRAGNVAPVAQPRPPAAIGRQPQPSLPRTGAGSVAVLLGGLALGGAFALRRFTKS